MSDSLVEDIRARADILEILGEYVQLRRSGKSYRGPCPLHGGDGPNFAVEPQRQIFKCFVCGEGGDVFGFLMKHLGLDFPEAVRHVGAKVGIEVPHREERREDPYAPLRGVLAFAAEWFQSRLREAAGAGARDYLKGRGLSLEEALDFGLGYADDEWRALRSAAARHGIEEGTLLELGLLATSERAEEPYDRFRGRLMFTIQDLRDRPIGFGGRILDASSDAPKYINSPESPVFHKGEELYGLNRARHAMRREGHAAIAEGFTDVIALHRAGLGFAVAGLGTSFTADQARRIGRYTKRAYLLYDSDLAGLRATFRTGDILLAAGIHPMVVSLPSGEDPDSLIRRDGPAAIRQLLDDAVDLLERKLQILRREGYLDRVEGRRRAVDGLLSTLRAVSDAALRDIYVDRAVEGLGIRRDTLVDEIARLERSRLRRRPPAAGAGRPRRGPSPASRTEHDLLLLLVRDPALTRQAVRVGLGPDHMSDPRGRELFEILSAASDEGVDSPDWTSASASAAELARALRESDRELPDAARVFDAVVRRLLYRRHRERIEEIGRAIELAEPEQQRRLLGEKQELVRELRAAGESGAFMPAAEGETPPAGAAQR
ncbi:MAG: DNA primase [Gemmatimonadota bacterium]|uniref:DNA primase n=1 Tax=Candidatus Palauibacter scopulicola TaxID=3056741 RepID=UPI00239E1805|nr:DNA primase [Candidatus Palauibacter scopulicola]MDE2663907.1 DNA primase [Candidatus Palauibacter scopulicola]